MRSFQDYLIIDGVPVPFEPSKTATPTALTGSAAVAFYATANLDSRWGVRWKLGQSGQSEGPSAGFNQITYTVNGESLTLNVWSVAILPGVVWMSWNTAETQQSYQVQFEYRSQQVQQVIEVEQYKGAFVRAPGTPKAERSTFEIETYSGLKVTRGGFNAAEAWRRPGVRRITHSSGASWTFRVTPTTLRDVPAGADLAPLLVNGARLKLAAGEYTLSRSVNVRNVIVAGDEGMGTTILWTGEDVYPGTTSPVTLIQASDSAFFDFAIDSTRRYNGSGEPGSALWKLEKEQRPRCFGLDDDCVVYSVTMIDFNRCCALGGGKSRRLIHGCGFGNTTRTYGVWFEGSDICVYDNIGLNTIFEHICRGGPSNPADVYGWEYVAIDGNSFANKDNRPNGDKNDDGKGTIVMQAGRYGYRRNNDLTLPDGPSGVGPLSVGAGAPAHQRTTCVVIDSDKVLRPVEIWPGAEQVTVYGTPIAPRMPHNLTGIGADPRRIIGLKTNYPLTAAQQSIIDTAAST